MRSSLCLLLFCCELSAQFLPLSAGLKAGSVRNRADNSGIEERIVPFTAGPYIEVNLPSIPSIEAGLLLKRYERGPVESMVYEVPLLLKKRFNAVAIKPFLSAGGTVRWVPEFDVRHGGITVAAGLTVGLLPIKIEPEIRYTRWLDRAFSPSANQTELLVGVRF